MHSKPQKQHKWLHKLVGEWTYEAHCDMGPGKPAAKFTGKESVRSIGGMWVVADGRGQMPGGGTATSIMTLGYDPQKKRFVGTWIGSMMPNLWVYDGALNRAGKALTLNTLGPNFAVKGKLAKYRDVIELKTKDHRMLTSSTPGKNGKWVTFMTAHYRRKK